MKGFKKVLLLTFAFALTCVTALAQTHKVVGVVKDVKGEPLIGVQIIPVGATQSGTITDYDGNYQVKVPNGIKQLKFTYMGYAPQTVNIKGRSKINIVMKEDTKMLDQVVVTAMGIKRKSKTLTYATQSVSGKDLTRVQDVNFVNALQGKTSGLTITPNSGGAGSASKILLRGNASIMGNNAPLIVVDGIPMSNGVQNQTNGYSMGYAAVSEGSDPLSSINPDDIASINVLKGANAAALYGSDAANGVIVITTKGGRDGKLMVNVTSNFQAETPMLLPEFQDTFGAKISASGELDGLSWGRRISEQTEKQNAFDGVNLKANNIRDFFNVGSTINNSISLSGGTKKIQSYLSVSNTTASGLMPSNKFQRNGITLRETFNFLDGKLKIDVSGNYVYQVSKNSISGGTAYNPLYNLYLAPRNIDMDYYKKYEAPGKWASNPVTIYPEYREGMAGFALKPRPVTNELSGMEQQWFQGRGVSAANNPYWLTNRRPSEMITQRIFATFTASYKLNEMFDFVYRANYDRNEQDGESKEYATTVAPTGEYIDRGNYSWTNNSMTNFYTDALANYHQTIKDDWAVSASLGASFKRVSGRRNWNRNNGVFDRTIYTRVEDLPTVINLFNPMSNVATQKSYSLPSDWSRSVFVTGQVGWKEKAYLDASYRVDWSRAFSQFGGDVNPFYAYYSIGANALMHEFFEMPEWVSSLKLRASISEVGNSIPNINFGALDQSISGATTAKQFTELKNPKPETVRSIEAGFDLSAFNNRLNFDFTYYNSTMFNQFLPTSGSSGTKLPVNSGSIRNQGVETTLSYSHQFTKDLRWRGTLNYAYNTNEILHTYNNRKDISTSIGAADQLRIYFREGESYGDLYVKDYARYSDLDEMYGRTNFEGKPVKQGDIRLTDEGRPQLDNNRGHCVYLGNMNAKHTLGLGNTISYKGIDFYFLIDGKIGGKVISFTEAYLDSYGVSKRSGDARNGDLRIKMQIEENGVKKDVSVPAVIMPDGNKAPAEQYYNTIGSEMFASQYVYSATNFRLREMSVGYTFRDLLGNGKNLSLSLIGRNLFFLYKDSPVDPDVSMSTANTLGGVDIFNLPTSRSLGLNVKFTL